MASSQWKAVERTVARLVGGTRSYDDRDWIDVLEDETGYALEVKNLTGPSVADCERYLRHNQEKADRRGLKSALIVKRRAGRGKRTPFLAVFVISEPLPDEESGLGTDAR